MFALDEVGAIYIANLDRDGRTRSHVSLPIEPAYVDVAMTPYGALASRVDQTVVLLHDDGSIASRLGTEPGQRLVTFAVSGERAVAMIETIAGDTVQRRVRWLVLAPALAWGTWIGPAGTDLLPALALSCASPPSRP